jgi:hypothetical protein
VAPDGVVFKLLGLLPRHRLIVAAIVGEAAATPVTPHRRWRALVACGS